MDIDTLIALLSADEPGNRMKATRVLQEADDLGPALAAALARREWPERALVVDGLASLDDPCAVAPLIALLGDADWFTRRNALRALAAFGDKRAVAPLITLLEDGKWQIRKEAAQALAAFGDKRAVAPLIALINDNKIHVREAAILALEMLGDGRAVVPLIALLDDPIACVRDAARESLNKLGGLPTDPGADHAASAPPQAPQQILAQPHVSGLDELIALLSVDDPGAKAGAIAALKMNGNLGPALAAEIARRAWSVRARVVEGLEALGDSCGVEPLIALLGDEDWSTRCNAARALGSLRDARAVAPLIDALADDTSHVRKEAALALGTFEEERAVGPLTAVLDDSVGWVRDAAKTSLSKLGVPGVDPVADVASTRARGGNWAEGASTFTTIVPMAAAIILTALLSAVILDSLLAAHFEAAHLWLTETMGEWRWSIFVPASAFATGVLGAGMSRMGGGVFLLALPALYAVDWILAATFPSFYAGYGWLVPWGLGLLIFFLIMPFAEDEEPFGMVLIATFLPFFVLAHWVLPAVAPETYLWLGGFDSIWLAEAALLLATTVMGLCLLVDHRLGGLKPAQSDTVFFLVAVLAASAAWPVGGRFHDRYVADAPTYESVEWQMLGMANRLFDDGQKADALTAYRSAAFPGPGLAEGSEGMGHTLIGFQRYEEAENAYSRAMLLDPRLSGAYLGRASVRWFTGDLKGSAEDYRRLVEFDPRRLYYLQLEKVLYEMDRPREVAEIWADAATVLPDAQTALEYRMLALEKAEEWGTLLRELPALVNRGDMKSPRVHFLYGRALNEAKRHDEAIRPLKRAVKLLIEGEQMTSAVLDEYVEELLYAHVWAGRRAENPQVWKEIEELLATKGIKVQR